jgi:hypothetical protein
MVAAMDRPMQHRSLHWSFQRQVRLGYVMQNRRAGGVAQLHRSGPIRTRRHDRLTDANAYGPCMRKPGPGAQY